VLKVARAVDDIVRGFNPDGSLSSIGPLVRALERYSEIITPWARSVGAVMLADVKRRSEKAWREQGHELGIELQHQIRDTPTGDLFRRLLDDQVELISSLPVDAARRVQHVVQEGMIKSTRSTEIAKDLLKTGEVTASRAKLIARTEVSKASVALTQARAQAIGSEGYIWRTVGDGDVRDTHRKMEGKYVRWDKPPKTDPSLAPYHAGSGPNCRCYPEPVLPEY
jgi:SPP1 gp7 family putative phage head morphogenesis protein